MTDDVSIKFFADVSDLQRGMQEASRSVAATIATLQSGATQIDAAFAVLARAQAKRAAETGQAAEASAKEQLGIAREKERTEYDIALNGLKMQSSIIKQQVQMAQIGHQEELADLLALEQQRRVITNKHLEFVRASYAGNALKQAQITRQIEELDSQSALRRQEVLRSVNREIYADYKRVFEQIGSSVSGSIMRMIQGHETLRQAAQKVALAIVQDFIRARIRMIAEWAAGVATKVTMTQMLETAQTNATVAGVAARAGAEQSGLAASFATNIASVLKSITASAAETFAGIFGFLSPVMGPAAAGPAATGQTTVLAVGASLPSFDMGAWSLPNDMVAQVHKGEMIVPAGPASSLRDALSGLSQSSASVHVHAATNFTVQALDSSDVKKWLRSNGKAILTAINDSVRNGSHLGLSKLNSPVGL